MRLQKIWLTRGPLAWALRPIAVIHLLLVVIRKAGYNLNIFKTTTFPVPVIVVGNVVVGGAGKTPLVIALANHFGKQGFSIGVVSRGYGRSHVDTVEVESNMSADQVGDEPALIKSKLSIPIVVAKKRVDAVQLLIQSYPLIDMVICDDGLQHYALHRDVEIIVFDDRGIGNGWLLPAGLLREPWPKHKPQNTQLVLHTGHASQFSGYVSTRRLAPIATKASGEQLPIAAFRNKRVSAIAAIANPEAFFDMLRSTGLVLRRAIGLPDHYAFTANLDGIDEGFEDDDAVFCTEKDAIKLFSNSALSPKNLFSVPLVFVPEPAFYTALDKLVAQLMAGKDSHVPFGDGHQINSVTSLPTDKRASSL